jgi:hypothetical protein
VTARTLGPPGKRRGPVSPPAPSNAEQRPRDSNVATIPPETVYVVHVTCGVLGWRRLYITAGSALTYADRMRRRGHEAEVTTAVLVGGAL